MRAALDIALFALPRYLLVALLFAVSYMVGCAVLRRKSFACRGERFLSCTALGLGVLAHVVLLIGLLGWLTTPVMIAAILGAAALGIVWRPKAAIPDTGSPAPKRRRRHWWPLAVGAGIVFGLLFLPLWLFSLYPPVDGDVISYHLAAPKHWLRIHTIDVTPFLRYQVGPNLAHCLFAVLMAMGGGIPPQILSVATMMLIAIGLYSWGNRLRGPYAGILAACLWLGSPATLEICRSASYHALATLFVFASIYSLFVYGKQRKPGALLLAGVFLGFAQGTWLGAFAFVPVFLATAVYLSVRERRLVPMFVILAGALLGWGPTLLRSMWYTGNPTYPMLTQLFGAGPWWTARDFNNIEGYVRAIGGPRTFVGFVTLPYSLVATPHLFEHGYGYSAALSLLAPLALVRAVWAKDLRWPILLVLFYVTCWFFSGQAIRYLLPIIPVLCLACALTAFGLATSFSPTTRYNMPAVVILAALAILAPGICQMWKEVIKRGRVPTTQQATASYIQFKVPEYKAITVANADPGPVYGLLTSNCAYYAESDFMGDNFGPASYENLLRKIKNPELFLAHLRNLGAKYLLISSSGGLQLPRGPIFDHYFAPVYGDTTAELFQILDSPRSISADRVNLMKNAGFEQLSDGTPVSWNRRGSPVVGAPDGGASSGRVAVEVSETSGFQQLIEVTPGKTYELTLESKTGRRGKVFRLQINWNDEKRQICGNSMRLFEAKESWNRYVARFTAPPCAKGAEIYASGHGADWVWMDNFEFRDTGAHLLPQTVR